MKTSFRWFGPHDPIPLGNIRQIPNMYSIVSAIYNIPVGDIWPKQEIKKLKEQIENSGLKFEVVESLPVHEEIKSGGLNRDKYIENFKTNIRYLSEYGVKVVCYNFMPVFDWTRTDLFFKNNDNSTSLALDYEKIKNINPVTDDISLPGWNVSYKKEDLQNLFREYRNITENRLWDNLYYFLKKIIPVAIENNIKMAIHPDDPPYNIFGLPRIIKNIRSYEKLFSLYENPINGVTFCSGSLAATSGNDIYEILDYCLKNKRVHFTHIRNIRLHRNGSFEETAHFSEYGSIDIVRIMKLLHKYNFTGYLRPDHGRMIWNETGKPGYGLYDRALGISYINGIWETLNKLEGDVHYGK